MIVVRKLEFVELLAGEFALQAQDMAGIVLDTYQHPKAWTTPPELSAYYQVIAKREGISPSAMDAELDSFLRSHGRAGL